MKLASAVVNGQEELLVMSERGAISATALAARYQGEPHAWTMDTLIQAGERGRELLSSWYQRGIQDGIESVSDYQLLAPVPRPGKIVCVGLNYRPHAQEARLAIPESPILFSKFGNAVAGPEATIKAPADVERLDYEAELVVVMGRRCAGVSEEDALDYVLGYCNGNDISARDLQFRTSQWLLGKTSDGFAPMGPYLVTGDDITDPDALDIVGRRNGSVVQHSNTSEMIFSCRYLISYISRYMTLEPGDVIFTGTPEGVILGQPEESRSWLMSGETVSVAIEGLGELVTHIG